MSSSHTVRISQSWSQAPIKPEPLPWNHTGEVPCNYTLMQALCPVRSYPVSNDDHIACLTCLKAPATRKAVCDAGCTGYNLWPNYCSALGPSFPQPPATADVQVFSDAPEVELFINGKSLGKQQNQPFNFSHFPNVQS